MSSRVARYENATSEPDFETAQQLANELGVPLAYMLAENDTLAEIILAVSSMSPTAQKRLLASLKTGKQK